MLLVSMMLRKRSILLPDRGAGLQVELLHNEN